MKKIQVGIIGCGRIAGHHARALSSSGEFKIAAFCDLENTKAVAYATEFSCKAYSNFRNMCKENSEIELVVVATPSGLHFEHAKEIVSKFSKHVIVEKPTVLKHSQLRELDVIANLAKRKIFPIFQNRYNLAVQRVRTALQDGELGKVNIASVRVRWCRQQSYYDLAPWRGTYALDGGALTNQGIHHIDLLRYLVGEIESVSAIKGTFGSSIEVEDTIVAQLKFCSGAVGTLEITTAARPQDYEASISLIGDKGMAQIGGIAANELQVFSPNPSLQSEFSEDFSSCVYGNGHKKIYKDISRCLQNGTTFPIPIEDAIKTIELLHAFYVSADSGLVAFPRDKLEYGRLGEKNLRLDSIYSMYDKI